MMQRLVLPSIHPVRFSAAAAFLGALLSSAPAYAQTCTSNCIASDTFWPHWGDSLAPNIGGSELTPKGQLGVGLVTTYQSRPITLQIPTPGPPGTSTSVIDHQITTHFLGSIGISKRLELGFDFPFTLFQSGDGVSAITGAKDSLPASGLRDVRFGFTFALLPPTKLGPHHSPKDSSPTPAARNLWMDGPIFSVTTRLEFSAPVGSSSGFSRDRTGVVSPSLAAELRSGRFFGTGEFGARIRGNTEFYGVSVGPQFSLALALGLQVLPDERLTAGVEARVLQSLAPQAANVSFTPAEWDLFVRTAPFFGGDLSAQLSGGGGLPLSEFSSPLTPRARFTLGLRYAPLERDRDGDGILDKFDQCPGVAEPKDDPIKDGCPDPVAPPQVLQFGDGPKP
jgi:hypothetical protein